MSCVNNKSISLFVGWLNVVLSFLVPLGQILLYMHQHRSVLTPAIYDKDFQLILLYLACGFVPWLIASILLVKGVRQARHKLMAPWICLNSLLICITLPVMVYVCYCMSKFSGTWDVGLYYSIPYAVQLVILILCLIPVRNLYKNLSNPPLVVPIQRSVQAKQPEDDQRYMPIFDN